MRFSLYAGKGLTRGAGRRAFFAAAPLLLLGIGSNCRSQEPDAKPEPGAKSIIASSPPEGGNPLAETGKAPSTGPAAVIVLPPSPILDEEGKQRLDPDGKPMFHPPVAQQRDKKGRPLFDSEGKPVMQTAKNMGYDENGKKITMQKEKPPRTVAVSVVQGTLTVDGLIGRAALNYEIADLRYVYFYAPWVGTVVVSNAMFPGATEQQNAFVEKTLTVAVGEHTFQLYSDKSLLGKKPLPAYVLVDRSFQLPTKMPVMGYGATIKAPYNWPGARLSAGSKGAPPLPESLKPTLLLPACPVGQMRSAGTTLPGETPREEPCVPIGLVKVSREFSPSPT